MFDNVVCPFYSVVFFASLKTSVSKNTPKKIAMMLHVTELGALRDTEVYANTEVIVKDI